MCFCVILASAGDAHCASPVGRCVGRGSSALGASRATASCTVTAASGGSGVQRGIGEFRALGRVPRTDFSGDGGGIKIAYDIVSLSTFLK